MVATGSVHADGEDEEAFMECLVAIQPAQGTYMPAVLKVRHAHGSADNATVEWSSPIMLLPGSHAAGRALGIIYFNHTFFPRLNTINCSI